MVEKGWIDKPTARGTLEGIELVLTILACSGDVAANLTKKVYAPSGMRT